MSRAARNRWIDVIGVIVTLVAGAGLMYFLLPLLVPPDQQVVPSLSASMSDPTQAFLAAFIAATAVGAPMTMAIVLALIMRKLSPTLPASSSAAPDTAPAAKSRKAVAPAAPQEMSRGEQLTWSIMATALSLAAIAGLLALFWPSLVKLFSGG
jgi:hypothetical protein